MKMRTEAANDMRAINDFVNENHITKDQIVSILQNGDGTYLLIYYAD